MTLSQSTRKNRQIEAKNEGIIVTNNMLPTAPRFSAKFSIKIAIVRNGKIESTARPNRENGIQYSSFYISPEIIPGVNFCYSSMPQKLAQIQINMPKSSKPRA